MRFDLFTKDVNYDPDPVVPKVYTSIQFVFDDVDNDKNLKERIKAIKKEFKKLNGGYFSDGLVISHGRHPNILNANVDEAQFAVQFKYFKQQIMEDINKLGLNMLFENQKLIAFTYGQNIQFNNVQLEVKSQYLLNLMFTDGYRHIAVGKW